MKKLKRPGTFEINMEPVTLPEKKGNRLSLEMVGKATDLMSHLFPDVKPEGPFIGSVYGQLFMNCLTIKYHMSAFQIPFDICLDFPEWLDKYDGQQLLQLRTVLEDHGNLAFYTVGTFPIEKKEIVTLDGSHPKWYFTTILTEMFLRMSYTCKKLMDGLIMTNMDFYPYL